MAALRGERLWRLELNASGEVVDREKLLDGEVGRVRDVIQAPDGSLWVSTSNHDSYGSPVSEQDDRMPLRRQANRMSPVEDTLRSTQDASGRPRPLCPRAVGRG